MKTTIALLAVLLLGSGCMGAHSESQLPGMEPNTNPPPVGDPNIPVEPAAKGVWKISASCASGSVKGYAFSNYDNDPPMKLFALPGGCELKAPGEYTVQCQPGEKPYACKVLVWSGSVYLVNAADAHPGQRVFFDF
jgi:hypothetical protein